MPKEKTEQEILEELREKFESEPASIDEALNRSYGWDVPIDPRVAYETALRNAPASVPVPHAASANLYVVPGDVVGKQDIALLWNEVRRLRTEVDVSTAQLDASRLSTARHEEAIEHLQRQVIELKTADFLRQLKKVELARLSETLTAIRSVKEQHKREQFARVLVDSASIEATHRSVVATRILTVFAEAFPVALSKVSLELLLKLTKKDTAGAIIRSIGSSTGWPLQSLITESEEERRGNAPGLSRP